MLDNAQDLARSARAADRVAACRLLSCKDIPDAAMALVTDLVADKDPTVRRAATAAGARIAAAHFARVADTLADWRDSASLESRSAAAAALASAADSSKLERAPRLVRLIEPLLSDPEPAVRRRVAPALAALLRAYPDAGFEALVGWSTSSDSHVLRCVALAFASASAAPLAKRALIVLRKLALDERSAVWRATAAAMWRIGRARPDIVRPELERWLEDEARVKVARHALKYL